MKILHTADWHLGVSLKSEKRFDEYDALLEHICSIIKEENITGGVVIGLPVNMNGSLGPRAEHAQKFASILGEKLVASGMDSLPIVMMDERMTTMAASRYLNETDTRGQKRKNVIDTLSAQIILQNTLDKLKNMK